MSEDAFGYNDGTVITGGPLHKNILIVDDINDTGATFNWIKEDWTASCMPMDKSWEKVWGNNVRFATLTDNSASEFTSGVSYTCHEVNKTEEDVWLVYPWENVGVY
jgi:hypoxanthine phosphoribosyltransferase